MGMFLPNCSNGLDCDFGPAPDFFDIEGMRTRFFDRDDNLIDTEELSFSDFGYLSVIFDVEYLVYEQKTKRNFGFINQAYGCSPEEPGLQGSKFEAFENITITTLNDFDEEHLADSSMNDLLRVMYLYSSELTTIDEFLDDDTNVQRPGLLFQLSKAPELNPELRLRINIELSTDEQYKVLTDPLGFI